MFHVERRSRNTRIIIIKCVNIVIPIVATSTGMSVTTTPALGAVSHRNTRFSYWQPLQHPL